MDNPFSTVLILKFTVTLFTWLSVALLGGQEFTPFNPATQSSIPGNGKDEEWLVPLVQITYPGIHKPVRMAVNKKTMLSNMQS